MPILTPTGVIIGLLFGAPFVPFKPAVNWLFAFITFTGALGMVYRDFLYVFKHPFVVLVSLLSTHIVMPVLVYLMGSLVFPGRSELVIGFVLLYSIPTAVVSYIWSSIYKGNGVLSLSLILIGTVLAPVVTPYAVQIISGTAVEINTTSMMLNLLYMVVIPSLLGVTFNTVTKGKANKSVAPYLKPFTKVALVLVIVINTSQVRGQLQWEWSLLGILGINLVFSVGGLILGYFIGKPFKYSMEDRISLTYAIGLRNISAALVLAINFFPAEASIPVLLGITTQQIVAAITGKILFSKRKKQIEEGLLVQ